MGSSFLSHLSGASRSYATLLWRGAHHSLEIFAHDHGVPTVVSREYQRQGPDCLRSFAGVSGLHPFKRIGITEFTSDDIPGFQIGECNGTGHIIMLHIVQQRRLPDHTPMPEGFLVPSKIVG